MRSRGTNSPSSSMAMHRSICECGVEVAGCLGVKESVAAGGYHALKLQSHLAPNRIAFNAGFARPSAPRDGEMKGILGE